MSIALESSFQPDLNFISYLFVIPWPKRNGFHLRNNQTFDNWAVFMVAWSKVYMGFNIVFRKIEHFPCIWLLGYKTSLVETASHSGNGGFCLHPELMWFPWEETQEHLLGLWLAGEVRSRWADKILPHMHRAAQSSLGRAWAEQPWSQDQGAYCLSLAGLGLPSHSQGQWKCPHTCREWSLDPTLRDMLAGRENTDLRIISGHHLHPEGFTI